MINVFVGSKNQAVRLVKRHNATHWISLLDLGDRQFLPPGMNDVNRLWLNFEDVLKPTDYGAPTKDHVQKILDFTKDITDGVVVVNCFAGVSRSTAAALAILHQHHRCIDTSISKLLEVRPQACPNPIISKYADDILGCNGQLFEASETVAKKKILPLLTSAWPGMLSH